MALKITTNARNFPFCVIAQDATGLGAALPEGLTVRISAAPPDAATISLDPNPLPINNPLDPASGTPSVASGVVNPAVKKNATATAEFIDASGASVGTVTDTIQVIDPAAGVPEWQGSLFGAALPLAVPTPSHASAAGAAAHHNTESEEHHKKAHK